MCGICGKLSFKAEKPDHALIETMCGQIVYRGPDDQGVHTDEHIGLGQRRLSIIDLDRSGCAPLTNEDRTVWIVFNGEIYNFKTLRKELEAKGHQFKTNTDTEVIVHQYEEDGIDCVKKLRGMFAFAVWDTKAKRLFCARDRLGQKPLCFTRIPDALIFGSEIKCITADPSVSAEPNLVAIDQYLTHRAVQSPLTAFENIHRLHAGEMLICDVSGEIKTE